MWFACCCHALFKNRLLQCRHYLLADLASCQLHQRWFTSKGWMNFVCPLKQDHLTERLSLVASLLLLIFKFESHDCSAEQYQGVLSFLCLVLVQTGPKESISWRNSRVWISPPSPACRTWKAYWRGTPLYRIIYCNAWSRQDMDRVGWETCCHSENCSKGISWQEWKTK